MAKKPNKSLLCMMADAHEIIAFCLRILDAERHAEESNDSE